MKTKHIKVWLSYAKFESSQSPSLMRKIYKRAIDYFKDKKMKEERAIILENWLENEKDEEEKEKIQEMMPRKVNVIQEGSGEEVTDYIFPNDNVESNGLKILEKALQWNEKKAKNEEENNNL